jgi:hypothetical protein
LAARKFGGQLKKACTSDWRESLSGVLEKVTLGAAQISLHISRPGLMVWLGASSNSPLVSNKDWICEIPYELRNRGQQLRIVPSEPTKTSDSGPDPTLVKLLRRAHDWRRQLETGQPRSILAERVRLTRSPRELPTNWQLSCCVVRTGLSTVLTN